MQTDGGESRELDQQRRRLLIARVILGQLQILGATCTFILVMKAGIVPVTIWAGVLTAAVTIASRLIFAKKRSRTESNDTPKRVPK